MKKRVAVTGGSGFIGKKIIEELLKSGYKVISLQRSSKKLSNVEIRHFDLSKVKNITKKMFKDIDIVIHAAALVHNLKVDVNAHQNLNFEATKHLFKVCEESEVEKFIFISTVGVYGVYSSSKAISLQTKTCPISPYAIAKLDSERMLLSSDSLTAISIIRLPLVYGENAPGNYGALQRLAKSKLPLPFLNTKNKRSMVSVDLVARVIKSAVASKKKHLGLHLLAEKKPYSTKEIIKEIRVQSGLTPMLFPFSRVLMKLILSAVGKRKIYEQLYEDLEFVSTI